MNFSDTTTLILTNIAIFSASVLAIITATLAIGLAYLVFKFGWDRVRALGDVSLADNYRLWKLYRQWKKQGINSDFL